MHIGIVAGEASGDQLGASLIEALQRQRPDVRITGMAGNKMSAAGCDAIANISELSVMGLTEVIRQYPRLRRLRDRICRYYLDDRPDVYVGIDVPDFNLSIAKRLKRAHIKSAHYVAPQIWAWRQSRARHLNKQIDLLLTLFPFETRFFESFGIETRFVGHPVATQFPMVRDVQAARGTMQLDRDGICLAIMPGSRRQEVERLAPIFLDAAHRISQLKPHMTCLAGVINNAHAELLRALYQENAYQFELQIFERRSHDILRASDVAIVASGTVTMEATFAKTPMVVAYRMAPVTYAIMRKLVKVPFIAMPNVVAERQIVPEFVQHDVHAQGLCTAALDWLEQPQKVTAFQHECAIIHEQLRHDAAERAARAILELAGAK